METTNETVEFAGETCSVVFGTYAVDQRLTAIQLCDAEGMPMARLTVYIDGLRPGEIAVDSNNLKPYWDEVIPALYKLGYSPTSTSIQSGFCTYPVWRKAS